MSRGAGRLSAVRGGERGDTLAEVVVATAITGILAVGLFASLTSATFSANALTRQDRLRNELLNATATIQSAAFVDAPPPYPNTTAYTLPPSPKNATLTVSVTDQPSLKLQVITVTASDGSQSLSQIVFKEQR